jgi:hypothetical protein
MRSEIRCDLNLWFFSSSQFSPELEYYVRHIVCEDFYRLIMMRNYYDELQDFPITI